MKNPICAIVLAAIWMSAGCAQTQNAAPEANAAAPADFSVDANWLCRPGRDDACAQDLTTTIIAADGAMTREIFTPNPNAAIDCFYVYPTVSLDPGGNSDLIPGPEERFVAAAQFARFASQCRTFAPMYRQVTLASLRARMNGEVGVVGDRALAYNDVLAAWRHYMAHDNHGRGVVLISHSQGTVVLEALIKNEIDGKPAQDQLVSAILLGANVVVPNDAEAGHTFQHVPGCRSPTQTGCVMSFVTFRASAPPPANSIFGIAMDPLSPEIHPNAHALCTNPADLSGAPAPLRSYYPSAGFSWTTSGEGISTPFVSMPGLVSGTCATNGTHTYLAIQIHAAPDDVRTHDIPGDVIVDGRLFPDWGLHRVDVNLALGDLVDVVGRQADAYGRRR
jgi:hypothetical protein